MIHALSDLSGPAKTAIEVRQRLAESPCRPSYRPAQNRFQGLRKARYGRDIMRSRNREARSACPIATTLDIVGDRWSLVILRDMVNGKKRFSEFLASPERITTNVLSDRLAMMEATGLIEARVYQMRPKRYEYELTEKGLALLPVLQEICRWANRFVPGTWVPPEGFMKKRAP